jgi:Undecaprenyl-phosphate galactose phosphotransferase WbaP
MVEAGATFQPPGAAKSDYLSRQRGDASFVNRFRKPIVAASLVFCDVVASVAAISLSRALVEMATIEPPNTDLPFAFLIVLFFGVGLYAGCGPSPYERFRLRAIAIVGFVAINILTGVRISSPGPLLAVGLCNAILLLIFGHYVEAMIRALLMHLDLWGASTAVIGCGGNSQRLAHLLMRQPALGLTPIGFIGTPGDRAFQNTTLPLPLIGVTSEPGRIPAHVEVSIFHSADELSAVASNCRAWPPCRLLLIEDIPDIQSLWLHTRALGEAIGIEIRRDLRLRHNQLLKRAIDILIAIPTAMLVCPIIAILALAIKLVDPGPAFYVQERVGRNSRPLRTFKLRTMYADAERRLHEHLSCDPQARAEWQRFFKLSRDPRVLPIIGKTMRRASLDELPQLWNVIRGDMSLVGPRPFPSYHMNSFDDEFQALRVSVQPGITGIWQVSSRSNGDLEVQRAQDLFYIRNWSIWLDLFVLLHTLPAVLSAKGAR